MSRAYHMACDEKCGFTLTTEDMAGWAPEVAYAKGMVHGISIIEHGKKCQGVLKTVAIEVEESPKRRFMREEYGPRAFPPPTNGAGVKRDG